MHGHHPGEIRGVLLSSAQQTRAASLPLTGVNFAGCVVHVSLFYDSIKTHGVTLNP
jgi:hypothetical protein